VTALAASTVALLLTMLGPSVASAAMRPPRPVVNSFSAAAPNPAYEQQSASPLTLFSTGGSIQLCAPFTYPALVLFNADATFLATLSQGGTFSGTFRLAAGELSVVDPTDANTWNLSWTPTFEAFGGSGPFGCPWTLGPSIIPGSQWELSLIPVGSCGLPAGTFEVQFEANGKTNLGTYSINGSDLILVVTTAQPHDTITLGWNPARAGL
jgi:hypothetical protein